MIIKYIVIFIFNILNIVNCKLIPDEIGLDSCKTECWTNGKGESVRCEVGGFAKIGFGMLESIIGPENKWITTSPCFWCFKQGAQCTENKFCCSNNCIDGKCTDSRGYDYGNLPKTCSEYWQPLKLSCNPLFGKFMKKPTETQKNNVNNK
jgi:hypothetical protein